MSNIFAVGENVQKPIFKIDEEGGVFIKDKKSNELVEVQDKLDSILYNWTGTKDEYNKIVDKNPNTLYFITD